MSRKNLFLSIVLLMPSIICGMETNTLTGPRVISEKEILRVTKRGSDTPPRCEIYDAYLSNGDLLVASRYPDVVGGHILEITCERFIASSDLCHEKTLRVGPQYFFMLKKLFENNSKS